MSTQKITPFLWFDKEAEDAAKFYCTVFKNSKILNTAYYGESGAEMSQVAKGSVMTVEFELNGQVFTALNGGPIFKFSEAISFMISCKDQSEIDYYWEKLTAGGGEESQCGWLKDKFGLSWQVTPENMGAIMTSSDPAKSERAMKAMLGMKKIIINDLEKA
jgi:predicted 3-demethylubiquinone-9 3-methyltransferase (glyoxalase superfamily)